MIQIRNILLPFVFFLSSCISIKEIEQQNPMVHTQSKWQDGVYSNIPNNIQSYYEGEALKTILFSPYKTHQINEAGDYKGSIKFSKLSSKRLKVDYFVDNHLHSSIILRGEFKQGSFVLNRKVLPIGIPFIFFLYKERVLILKTKDDKLSLIKGVSDFSNVLFFSAGQNSIEEYDYKLIHKSQ